ncbi:hypothetical protein A2572_00860 [Candidatus Collierbacteria bacterium RIFOXYD1_FULL_40_9]|uniref:Uncharacterized protein n=1 Tax=Candidatus Collierbacteria bacterium RIFOXYD1_FULL_40_9 TaxID=1817731 RepID=A0A1F5FVY8_9BACT|nr:MAG: hypothetical protein A2572_00860 [Candidatus Collierbacteria bacterium RIFOXYD1_FULL_40_9]
MKNKKTLLITSTLILLAIIIFFTIQRNKTGESKSFFLNTIPLLNQDNKTKSDDAKEVIYPPINPAQTNYQKVAEKITDQISEIEKDKMVDDLPIYIDNFVTGTKINTTINVYSLVSDPPTSVRIEIYGPNYNNAGLLSEDAKAFKASFEEIKKYLKSKKVNLSNLQIIYGNRQYIQDTATLWVKEFKLLD